MCRRVKGGNAKCQEREEHRFVFPCFILWLCITGAATSDPYGSDGVPLITFCARAKKNRWKDRGATPRRRHRLRSQHPPLRPPRHCARCTLRLRHLPRLRAQQHPAIIAADSMQQAPAQTHSASTRRPRRMVLRRRRISEKRTAGGGSWAEWLKCRRRPLLIPRSSSGGFGGCSKPRGRCCCCCIMRQHLCAA